MRTSAYNPRRRRRSLAALVVVLAAGAGTLMSPRAAGAAGEVRISVLMYHYIRVNPVASDHLGDRLSVTPDDFFRQMEYLRQIGGHTVSLSDVMDAIEGTRTLSPRAVVLTFDDAYGDFATAAAPIMVAHGFIGTTYAVPGFLDHPNYMTTAQLQHVAAMGMVVGAHTVHHVDLPRLSHDAAWAEIAGSRDQLRQLTGQPITDFAYPYGHLNSRDIGLVERAGFRDATTTADGHVHSAAQRFAMPRVRVNGGETLAQFAAALHFDSHLPSSAAAASSGAVAATPVPNEAKASSTPLTRPSALLVSALALAVAATAAEVTGWLPLAGHRFRSTTGRARTMELASTTPGDAPGISKGDQPRSTG